MIFLRNNAIIRARFVQQWPDRHGPFHGKILAQSCLIQKGRSSAEAHAILTGLLQFLRIAPVDQNTIEQTLNLDFHDFEDAVQMVSALQIKADCLITRNVKDYPVTLLPVIKPVDFLGHYKSQGVSPTMS